MNKEFASGLFLLCIGLFALINSIHLPMGTWAKPGIGIFPFIVSFLLCIVGILIFFSGKGKVRIGWHESFAQEGRPVLIIVLTGVFILAFERIGYMVATSLYLLALFLWVCRYRLWTALGLSVGLTIVNWCFFGKMLGLPLPSGPWNL